MSETLKAWAHNASNNPADEHQKQHAEDTLMLIAERDRLKAEVELQIDDRHKLQKELNAMENEHFNETNKLKRALEREREANAKLREALIHIYEPAQNRECCMRAMKEDELDNHMVEIAFNATHDEPLLAAKQDEGNG